MSRLGRSPDRGDAVVMAFTGGQGNAGWQAIDPSLERPKVIGGRTLPGALAEGAGEVSHFIK